MADWNRQEKRPATFCYSYFNEPELLEFQLKIWELYPPQINIIIADDCSQDSPAYDILKNENTDRISLFYVKDDLGFNSHGCRNMMVREAKTNQVFFTDIDMFIDPATAAFIRDLKIEKKHYHQFAYWHQPFDKRLAAPGHFNSFFVRRDDFIDAGGYDESFVGLHHGDREMFDNLDSRGFTQVLHHKMYLTGLRTGRKTVYVEGLKEPYYTDEEYFLERPPPKEELMNTITSKVNFEYERLL